jgi:cellulose synthase/poly-beta-1,6-N-acetylglucosamine synthase-like glycosyltransferase
LAAWPSAPPIAEAALTFPGKKINRATNQKEKNMLTIRTIVEVVYMSALLGLALFGLNSLIMAFLYWRTKHRSLQPTPMIDWPTVTIQLPVFNERYIVKRLLKAVTALDYPRDKLQIQMLDDSTDDTAELVRRLVKQYRSQGYNIELIRRTNRQGFKAGALAEGMKTAIGELIGVLDADFMPPADWLKKVVVYFDNPKLACMQTRWGHVNHDHSIFTQAQALGIDGHFIVEQTARSRNNLFLNFNGTAGVWRRTAIEDAGGWQPDTLTEDLDLSYRVQLRGWQIEYLPDVVVPAELPAQVEAFKKQQFRWAKGSFQVVRKLFMCLMKADIPTPKRLMGVLHITGYFVHPLMLTVLLLFPFVGFMAPHFLKIFPWTVLTAFGPPVVYFAAQSEYTPHLSDRVRLLPMLILIGFGMSLNNTVAVLQGLFNKDMGTFTRTPKFNVTSHNPLWRHNSYVISVSPLVWGEIFLGLYALAAIILLVPHLGWEIIPWLLIYVGGYFYIAGLNLYQSWQNSQFNTATIRAS